MYADQLCLERGRNTHKKKGIGRGTVLGLAKHGIQKMALGDLQEKEMHALAADVQEAHPGVECLVLPLDVTSEASVHAAVHATVERFGRIDIGLNIAGIAGPGAPAPAVPLDRWKATFDVNVHGVWLSQRAEIAQMLQQEYGLFQVTKRFNAHTHTHTHTMPLHGTFRHESELT